MRPFTILFAAIFVALLAFGAGAEEFRIAPAEAAQRSTTGTRWEPRIAAGAAGFLVAWIDHRPPGRSSWALAGRIRGMRFDADGTRLEERDFEIAPGNQGLFSVASDGRDYLVAHPVGPDSGSAMTELVLVPGERGARPRPLGLRFDGYPLALTFAGGHYILAADGRLHVLDRAGNLVRYGIRIGGRPLSMRDGRLLLFWSRRDVGRVSVLSVSDLLAPGFIAPPEELPVTDGYFLDAAEGASGFALLLLEGRDVRAVLLDHEARGITASVPIGTSDLNVDESLTVARLGNGYAVLASGIRIDVPGQEGRYLENEVAVIRLNAAGKVLQAGPDTMPSHDPYQLTSAPGAAGTAMVAYSAAISTIRVQRLALGGAPMLPGEGVIASMSRPSQDGAAVARCAGFDAVAWLETDGEWRRRVMLRRFAFDGRPLGPAVQLGTAYGPPPTITCGRTNALVTWTVSEDEQTFVSGALVDAFSPPRAVPLTEPIASPLAVTFDGTHYVGATVHFTVSLYRWNEQGQRTAMSEFAPAADIRVVWTTGSLAWNGRELLLVVQLRGAIGGQRVIGYRLDRDLKRIGEPILIHERGGHDTALAPMVAASPDAWLVGWAARGEPVVTSRILRDGTRLDPFEGVGTQTTTATHILQMAWNGTRWEIVTGSGVITRSRDGTLFEEHADGMSEGFYGVTSTGPSRLIVYSRVDPVDGVYELYGDVVEPEWTVNAPRRRTARR